MGYKIKMMSGAHRYVDVKSFLGDSQVPLRVPVFSIKINQIAIIRMDLVQNTFYH